MQNNHHFILIENKRMIAVYYYYTIVNTINNLHEKYKFEICNKKTYYSNISMQIIFAQSHSIDKFVKIP
jgi:hypothetical protein